METTNEGKAEKAFKNFGKKVDDFLAELDGAGEKFQKEFNAMIAAFCLLYGPYLTGVG